MLHVLVDCCFCSITFIIDELFSYEENIYKTAAGKLGILSGQHSTESSSIKYPLRVKSAYFIIINRNIATQTIAS